MSWYNPLSWGKVENQQPTAPVIEKSSYNPMSAAIVGAMDMIFNGEKFTGGLGPASFDPVIDYGYIRAYSWKLFYENTYARGLLSRLVTNEVGTGLRLEATPVWEIVGMTDEESREWSSDVERKFRVWGSDEKSVHWSQELTFQGLQEIARLHSLISGDVLFVLRYPAPLNLPVVELIDGARLVTPMDDKSSRGNRILNGVEIDGAGRQVAYHVMNSDGLSGDAETIRIPAWGEKSKRRLAWLMYAGPRRIGRTRGVPLLAAVLQSLKEIDRYRDAEQRAALINAFFALSIERENAQSIQSNSITGGATRRDTVVQTDADGGTSTIDFTSQAPGIQVESLGVGEKLVSHATARPNVNFGTFENSIISAVAWGEEVPPEILRMSFSSNYSASKAAVNEFNAYLKRRQRTNAEQSTKPIYDEWLVAKVLLGHIKAPGLLQARRSPLGRELVSAWCMSEWPGPIKPSVDLGKDVKAYKEAISEGLVTRERAAADLFGARYDDVVKRLSDENSRLGTAQKPLVDAGLIKPDTPSAIGLDDLEERVDNVLSLQKV